MDNNKNLEELLNLIESEDVFALLSEENLEGLNQLMKYELITIKDEKVYLTQLGKEAQVHGVKNIIARRNVEKVVAEIPVKIHFKARKDYMLYSLLFLFLSLLLLAYQLLWL